MQKILSELLIYIYIGIEAGYIEKEVSQNWIQETKRIIKNDLWVMKYVKTTYLGPLNCENILNFINPLNFFNYIK